MLTTALHCLISIPRCTPPQGTMDSILCGEGSVTNVAKICQEVSHRLPTKILFSFCSSKRCSCVPPNLLSLQVSRVLKPNGVYVVVSYGQPDTRLGYLENSAYLWKVRL